MMLRNRAKTLSLSFRIGLALFCLANVTRIWTMHRPGNYTDALIGLLYGISIGCMLTGLYRRDRCPNAVTGSAPDTRG
jgi:hypothetical protein